VHKSITRVAVAAAAVVSALGVTGAKASGAAAGPGAQLWVKRYGPGDGFDLPQSVAVSPRGDRVFVTGSISESNLPRESATVAYSAATGAQLWTQRYGSASDSGGTRSVAVSPDGTTVFVTGTIEGTWGGDYLTVAYNAATGARLWVQRYGRTHTVSNAYAVAVSPAGDTVFVTGDSAGTGGYDPVTVAYDAATGAQLWVGRYAPGDYATSMAVSPDGDTVFVTGSGYGHTTEDYITVAYNAATGAQLWVQRYNGPANGDDFASSVAVSPDGGTVFVTGQSLGATSGWDYATVAYDAATGARQWAQRYTSSGDGSDVPVSIAVSAGRVFVTGSSAGATSGSDYATVAYDAATGARRWAQRYNGPGNSYDNAFSMAVRPGTLFVTGMSVGATSDQDYATVAYRAATGARLWVQRYNGPANYIDEALSIAVSADRVFVTGYSAGASGFDYATVAYRG
jgi:outer membrane protein assembly factor BamB